MQAKYLKLSEKAQKRENAPLAIRLIGSIFKRTFSIHYRSYYEYNALCHHVNAYIN